MEVFGSLISPAFFIGTGSVSPFFSFAVGVKISALPLDTLVMISGRPSAPTSSASASCGLFSG
ncbi:hypothetical protein B0E54_06212 [Micromonospora sp. MH99]|nr:hypothetical protein [Micromonospora sp. MH99]